MRFRRTRFITLIGFFVLLVLNLTTVDRKQDQLQGYIQLRRYPIHYTRQWVQSVLEGEHDSSASVSGVELVADPLQRRKVIRERLSAFFESKTRLKSSMSELVSHDQRIRILNNYFYFQFKHYLQRRRHQQTGDGSSSFYQYPERIPLLPARTTTATSEGDFYRIDEKRLFCKTNSSDAIESRRRGACVCLDGWRGVHCSIAPRLKATIVDDELLSQPRRIIYTLAVNHEIDQVMTILESMWHVVDLFIVAEMNITEYGDPRPLLFLTLLETGLLHRYESKVFYLACPFPEPRRCLSRGNTECDDFKYECIQCYGIDQLEGLHGDDLIVYTDADEHLSADVLMTLKHHSSQHEHYGALLQSFAFSCAWESYKLTLIQSGATYRFVYRQSLLAVRGRRGRSDYFGMVSQSTVGSHCSWCFDVDGILLKLVSAPNVDLPRWGDYSSMVNVEHVRFLITYGVYFDLRTTLVPVNWTQIPDSPFKYSPHCKRYQ